MKLPVPAFCLAMIVSLGMASHLPGMAQESASASNNTRATPIAQLRDWFNKYDAVRRQAQMNPVERAKADAMLAKGLAIVMPGPDKLESQGLFQMLQSRNAEAAEQLKRLPLYPETEQLHRGYHKYFQDASSLFGDYLRVQNNLMTPDPATGKPLMGQLIARKKALEDVDIANKELDAQLRDRFKIPAYRYQ